MVLTTVPDSNMEAASRGTVKAAFIKVTIAEPRPGLQHGAGH